MTIKNFPKDPDAILDWEFDWSDWLQDGETISSYVVTVPSGLTLASHAESDGLVTAWCSGGTSGGSYVVACKIVTSEGRTDERSLRLEVEDR